MKKIFIGIIILFLFLVVGVRMGSAEEGKSAAVGKKEKTGVIKVTIITKSGKYIYSKNLVSLEILVDKAGEIKVLHVIHISGTEKDTHSWYNFDNVESFTYRYYTIAGKGRVKIKQILGPLSREEDQDAIPAFRYEDYR